MIFPTWHRLVDLHEREIRALRAHGIPIQIQKAAFEEAMHRVMRYLHEPHIRALLFHGIPIETQKAAFEEAMNRVVRSTVAGVAEVSGESWRAPAQKSSKALVVYQALSTEMSSQNPPQPELNQSPARRPADRVVEIWNSNSRDKAVTRYTSRSAGVARLWKASQPLAGVMEPSDAEGPRPAKPAKRTPAMKAKAAKKAAPTKKASDKRSARSKQEGRGHRD